MEAIAQLEDGADTIAAWEKAVGWTAPEDGLPGSDTPPFPLGGVSEERLDVLIKESPDVRATRILVGDTWLQIYAGNHPEHESFTVIMEECKNDRSYFVEFYVVNKGRLLIDNNSLL